MGFFKKKGQKNVGLDEIPLISQPPTEFPSILYRLNENTTCHKINESDFYYAFKNATDKGYLIQKLPITSQLFDEEFSKHKKYKDKNGIFHYGVFVFPSNYLELAQISYLVSLDWLKEQMKEKTKKEISQLIPQINRGSIKLFSSEESNLKSLADKLSLPFDEKFMHKEKLTGLY